MPKNDNQSSRRSLADDVKAFEEGLEAVHKKKWASARKTLEEVAASQMGTPLGERARRYLEICDEQSSDPADDGDLYLAAVVAKNDGDLESAMDFCNRGGMKGRDERFAYLAAAVEGLREAWDESARLLESAIEMNPDNRVHAYHDPDFQGLRDHPDYGELFAGD